MSDVSLSGIIKGLQAGGVEAVLQARRYGTKLVIWREGKIVEITPDEADEMIKKLETQKDQ